MSPTNISTRASEDTPAHVALLRWGKCWMSSFKHIRGSFKAQQNVEHLGAAYSLPARDGQQTADYYHANGCRLVTSSLCRGFA